MAERVLAAYRARESLGMRIRITQHAPGHQDVRLDAITLMTRTALRSEVWRDGRPIFALRCSDGRATEWVPSTKLLDTELHDLEVSYRIDDGPAIDWPILVDSDFACMFGSCVASWLLMGEQTPVHLARALRRDGWRFTGFEELGGEECAVFEGKQGPFPESPDQWAQHKAWISTGDALVRRWDITQYQPSPIARSREYDTMSQEEFDRLWGQSFRIPPDLGGTRSASP